MSSSVFRLLIAAALLPLPSWPVFAQGQGGPRVPQTQAQSQKDDAPATIEADRLSGKPGEVAVGEGSVVLKRGDITVKGDRLEYKLTDDLATADGAVTIDNLQSTIVGTHLSFALTPQTGVFDAPSYVLKPNNAEGHAKRFEFLGPKKSRAIEATYSSCRRADYAEGETLPWELRARRVDLDFDKNEGVAESAVLRFYDVPILALPGMSFPLTGQRKTGWLPPTFELSNRAGFGIEAPWYWNLAPNQDLTLTPTLATKHGAGAKADYRYLLPSNALGELKLHGLPNDQLVQEKRWSSLWTHQSVNDPRYDVSVRWQRASDDAYWKDYAGQLDSPTPRLLNSNGQARWHWLQDNGETTAYIATQRWQVLQDVQAPIVSPYRRAPQIGLRGFGQDQGLNWSWETESNRFTHIDPSKISGSRVHATATAAWPLSYGGLSVTPRATVNAARYDTEQPMSDGRTQAQRTIPTFSLDNALQFEREVRWFGQDLTQTLEPRVMYIYTPFREQRALPIFDTAAQDFNFASVFAENTFSGIDRISDANRITTGLTTRWLNQHTGAETARVGLVQRHLLSQQEITPGDAAPLTQRQSDLLLLGSTSVVPKWQFDASAQYSQEIARTTRSTLGARYFPGPFRTVGATYRFTRGQLEQVDTSWQWPLTLSTQKLQELGLSTGSTSGRCGGTWYGLGRINYSLRESRTTDSVLGLEYNATCWIGRFFVSRLSTGLSEAKTEFGMQIEFVGFSKIGTSPDPIKFLSENIAGYQSATRVSAPINSTSP